MQSYVRTVTSLSKEKKRKAEDKEGNKKKKYIKEISKG